MRTYALFLALVFVSQVFAATETTPRPSWAKEDERNHSTVPRPSWARQDEWNNSPYSPRYYQNSYYRQYQPDYYYPYQQPIVPQQQEQVIYSGPRISGQTITTQSPNGTVNTTTITPTGVQTQTTTPGRQ